MKNLVFLLIFLLSGCASHPVSGFFSGMSKPFVRSNQTTCVTNQVGTGYETVCNR